jgi:hypothetical protein
MSCSLTRRVDGCVRTYFNPRHRKNPASIEDRKEEAGAMTLPSSAIEVVEDEQTAAAAG